MNPGQEVRFNIRQHPHVDYGYATSHNRQGQTADRVLVRVHRESELLVNSRVSYVSVFASPRLPIRVFPQPVRACNRALLIANETVVLRIRLPDVALNVSVNVPLGVPPAPPPPSDATLFPLPRQLKLINSKSTIVGPATRPRTRCDRMTPANKQRVVDQTKPPTGLKEPIDVAFLRGSARVRHCDR